MSFDIDTKCDLHNLKHLLSKNSLGKVKISIENILSYPGILVELSYPIIETKNTDALMPMDKVLDAIRRTIKELSGVQKSQLLESISTYITSGIDDEFKKYSSRKKISITKEEYQKEKLEMAKNRLRSKFGLSI